MPEVLSALLKVVWQHRTRKLLAALLAVVSWYAIRGAISFENRLAGVPLNIRLKPEWAVLDRSTDVADIVFRGSRDDLFRLNRANVELVLDLQGKEFSGSSTIRLEPSMIVAPGAARAIEIEPSEVTVQLDRQATRQVPVKIDLQGTLPEGVEMESALADPATVTVAGPKQMIETLSGVRTAPVALDARRQSFRERVELIQPGETWLARLDPQRINVRITLRERSEERAFKAMVLQAFLTPSMEQSVVSVLPVTVDVVVKGAAERLNQLDKAEIIPYVDCRELKLGSRYELPIKILAPEGIVLDATDPASAMVAIQGN